MPSSPAGSGRIPHPQKGFCHALVPVSSCLPVRCRRRVAARRRYRGAERLLLRHDPLGRRPPAAGPVPVNFQLGWIANVENMGLFMADHGGYFKDEGST